MKITTLLWFCLMTAMSPVCANLSPHVPEPLKPWVAWTLYRQESFACPFQHNAFDKRYCLWFSSLQLDSEPKQGEFKLAGQAFAEQWLQLPGESLYWPQTVTLNGKPVAVLQKKGKPFVKVTAGRFLLAGYLYWDFLPNTLEIPADFGILQLRVNNTLVSQPFIKNNRLWLVTTPQPEKTQKDQLDIQVFRKIVDENPMQMITRVQLKVSGKTREIKLSQAVLQGFIPVSIVSPLPARWQQGQLQVQVRSGNWVVDVLSRRAQEVMQLTLQHQDKLWPQKEIWVFDAKPSLRMVNIESLQRIDPQQSNLPQQWRHLPAYQMSNGETMSMNVIRRGEALPRPDQLNLTKQLWLDFDGLAYTVEDRIQGSKTQNWRLTVQPEMQLGQVTLAGRKQLITTLADSEQAGVEVRQGNLQLSAVSRIKAGQTSLPASGWQQKFIQLTTQLHLPPGWKLFTASGVDDVPGSWVSQWTLLDLFLVLISALAFSRLWHVWVGILALITLILIWHEPGAPQMVWLNLLAATALLRVLPKNRFYSAVSFYRMACVAVILLISISFVIEQVRQGLYPQLYPPLQQFSSQQHVATLTEGRRSSVMHDTAVMEKQALSAMPAKKQLRRSTAAAKEQLIDNFQRIDPKAVTQTGPGIPQWQWQTLRLQWNGPVDAQQRMRLWLISPFCNLLLNFVRVLLLSLMILFVLGGLKKSWLRLAPQTLSCFLLFVLLGPVPPVQADIPPQSLLKELRERLTEQPDCLPSCAEISAMHIDLQQQTLTLKLSIDAEQDVAVPLPNSSFSGFPQQVWINGQADAIVFGNPARGLWVHVSAGRQQVRLQGALPQLRRFSLQLPLKPHRVTLAQDNWRVSGLHEHGRIDPLLDFTSTLPTDDVSTQAEMSDTFNLPPFLRLQRTLQLGLDWHVVNRLSRLNDSDAVSVRIPLLASEQVLSGGFKVKNATLLAQLPKGVKSLSWRSRLSVADQIHLKTSLENDWHEIWQVDVSPVWHLQHQGIAVVFQQNAQGKRYPEWRPWPGEEVMLTVSKPVAIDGQKLTIDESQLIAELGKRNRNYTLSFDLRSSLGKQHPIKLPAQAELQTVKIDGKTHPLKCREGLLTLPIHPGKQSIEINWHIAEALGFISHTPTIDLRWQSVNNQIRMRIPKDRWVLFAWGPELGPAVLFWGVLIVILLLSIALGKISITPLKHWQWLLLLVGLSQIPVLYAMIVTAWLLALGMRQRQPLQNAWQFNGLQIGIVILTGVAIILLFLAVEQGLLGRPEMQIAGNGSNAQQLNWYQDRNESTLPVAGVISVPLYIYRVLMLLWSLWLAVSLLNWLKWGWQCFSGQGLWKKRPQDARKVTDEQEEIG